MQRDLQPDVRSDWDEVRRELDRCRRYGRTFALVSLPECDHATAASLLRVVDRVWEDADAVYALLPESSASDAARLIGRLHREAPTLAEGATFAAFPQDGMTMRALVDALADRRPDPAESPVAAALGARLRERRSLAIAGDVSAAATAPASSNGRARDSR